MKTLFTFALALLLISCSTKLQPAEALRLSCEGFAAELNILAPLRADGVLSATAVKIVQTQKDAVDPICTGEAPDINSDVKQLAVDNGLKVLVALVGQYTAK